MSARTFKAILGGDKGALPRVVVPFDVVKAFGAAHPKVKATVNGVELRTTVSVYGGVSYVGFRKEARHAMGIALGNRIEVKLEFDAEPRVVAVPDNLARAFQRDSDARRRFDALAFTHRREYAQWVDGAKKAETRAMRVAKTLAMLKAGTKHP